MEAGDWRERVFLEMPSVKLRLVDQIKVTVLAFQTTYTKVSMGKIWIF